jgi:hypothetical protein
MKLPSPPLLNIVMNPMRMAPFTMFSPMFRGGGGFRGVVVTRTHERNIKC